MKKESFDYIWKELVLPSVNRIVLRFTEEQRNAYHFEVRSLEGRKEVIEKEYNAIRDFLKRHYYKGMSDSGNSLIDNHKIAACLCFAFLRNKIFSFKITENMPTEMFTSNYELAYTISMGFIFRMLIIQYERNNAHEFANKLKSNGKLFFPATSEGHDEYIRGRINALALNDLHKNTFDLLGYSDMMFWIEYYNRQRIENTITPMRFSIV